MKTLLLAPVLLLLALTPASALRSADASPEAQAAFALGQQKQKEQHLADAIAAFEKATQLDATRADYFSALGIALSQRMREVTFIEQGQLALKLRKAFAKSVELDPQHLPGLIGLTRFHTNAPEIAGGSLEKAKTYAERIRALNPLLGELELGAIAERGEDFAAALEHYDAAGKLAPKNAQPLVGAGRVLAQLGRSDEARSRFEAALALDPQREEARNAIGRLGAK